MFVFTKEMEKRRNNLSQARLICKDILVIPYTMLSSLNCMYNVQIQAVAEENGFIT